MHGVAVTMLVFMFGVVVLVFVMGVGMHRVSMPMLVLVGLAVGMFGHFSTSSVARKASIPPYHNYAPHQFRQAFPFLRACFSELKAEVLLYALGYGKDLRYRSPMKNEPA